MISIDSEFSHYFNGVIHSFVAALYYEGFDDDEDRLESAATFFPVHIWREKPEACLRVMDNLYYWTKDHYMHELDNLHQLGLYGFLRFVEDYKEDTGDDFYQIFYSGEEYKKVVNDIWKSTNITEVFDGNIIDQSQLADYLQDMSTIIESCFDDIDFITFPELLAANRDDGSDPYVVGQLIDEYVDILPQDIVASYRKRFKDYAARGGSLFQIVGKLLEGLAHMAEYDTLGIALSSGGEKNIQHILNPLFKTLLLDSPDIHMAYESSLARANPDFIFQRGEEVVIVEVKLGSANIKRGIEKQLTHYMDALRAKESYMLIVCQSDKQLLKVEECLLNIQARPGLAIRPFVFNASSEKHAASRL